MWQIRYCKGDFQTCKRLELVTQGKEVPLHLLPNGKMLHSNPAEASAEEYRDA